MTWTFLLFLLAQLAAANAAVTQCGGSRCGTLEIPFPFYIPNNSCAAATTQPPISAAFSLSCLNSSALFLNVSGRSYKLLQFFPDGVLLDFSNATGAACYGDLERSFPFSGDEHLGVSTDNVLDLYDCEDSSLCKADCETTAAAATSPSGCGSYPSCCYPLSGGGAWRPGKSLSVFASKFGCRGFSSRVVLPRSTAGMRGIKLEWAMPGNSTTCAADADIITATSVESGIRCRCRAGFSGDGFSVGDGCIKSCFKDGKEARGDDCCPNNHHRRKPVILAGVITAAAALVFLTIFYLLKRPVRPDKYFFSDQTHSQKACLPARLFTYRELEVATKGFADCQKIAESPRSTIYNGAVHTGSHEQNVAVQLARDGSERELSNLLFRVEALAAVSHPNMARVIGWSGLDLGPAPLVVYEYPGNGTLRDHLWGDREDLLPLDWLTRLRIVYETVSLLVFLQHQVLPPVMHGDLRSGHIFLDTELSVKLAGFELQAGAEATSRFTSDIYGLGVILLEILAGKNISPLVDFPAAALRRIKNGRLEEIVDPRLYYNEWPASKREQVEAVADLATRCVLFGADGRLGLADVARELANVTWDCVDAGPAVGLKETFSNSSLLQMISMSPDSNYVP